MRIIAKTPVQQLVALQLIQQLVRLRLTSQSTIGAMNFVSRKYSCDTLLTLSNEGSLSILFQNPSKSESSSACATNLIHKRYMIFSILLAQNASYWVSNYFSAPSQCSDNPYACE